MLQSFAIMSLICLGTFALTWLAMYEILAKVWNILPRLTMPPRLRVMLIGIPVLVAHIIGIWLYGIAYFLTENYLPLGQIVGAAHGQGVHWAGFLDCLYFSAATYTSLGLGDMVPTENLRMLAGAEALNGLVMIGWTISFTYLTMEKFWAMPPRKKR